MWDSLLIILNIIYIELLPIYNDKYGRVQYDDDHHHHVIHGIRGFANLRKSGYGQLVRL